MKILHYGLQRSGTNLLESLLKANYRVKLLNSNRTRSSPLQKHFRLYDRKDLVPEPRYHNNIYVVNFSTFEALFESPPSYYVVISKDPYSWYLSYQEWAKRCHWPAVSHSYIEEYNCFYGKFLELASETDKILFVRYVDLLADNRVTMDKLAERMQLKRRSIARFLATMPGRVAQSARFSDERRHYYLHEGYMTAYAPAKLHELNRLLDSTVIDRLGYARK